VVLFVEMLAIGPFKRELTPHFEYSADRYAKTRESAPVVQKLFGIVEGTQVGTEFAQLLGISDPWDFNQHKVDPHSIDFAGLKSLLASREYADEYLSDLDALQAFASAGYDLYFLPNG
jgi:hypothetical protein